MRRLLWVPLFAALAACPPPVDVPDGGSDIIVAGPEGGLFAHTSGAVINIPKGALATEVTITVETIDDRIPDVPNRKRISLGYRFRPTSLKFNEQVIITLPYDEARIPAKGIDPSTFDMRRFSDTDPYLQLPGPDTLVDVKSVLAKTDQLGLFWITSPLKPAVSELKLTPQEATLQVGQSEQFTAEVTDPAGNPLPDVEVKWSIVPARVAKVDATGKVEALDPGTATLTAAAGDAVAVARIYVVGTTVGPRTFLHENPFPTGNDLYGGFIHSGNAVFVGGNATVLGRAPNDAWTRYYSAPAVTLRDAAGVFPTGVVAVGASGTAGVLVEMTDPAKVPSLKIFDTVEPRSVWFDGTHGMAVGYGNDVIIRENGQWVEEYSPSFETLLDVIGDGQGGFVTVGDRGSVYQFDPVSSTWDSLYDTQLSVLLGDAVLANAAGTEGWGVGANKLWHFQGSGWTAINLPTSPSVTSLTSVGLIDGKVVVAGAKSNQGVLLIYTPDTTGNAGTWTSVQLRPQQIIHSVFGAGTDGYAVGSLGAVWQYAGGTFVEVSDGFYGDVADVFATSAISVAAVNECSNAACTSRTGKVVRRTAQGRWEELGFQPFNGPLFAVAAKSETEVYASGEGSIWRYDGQSWIPQFISGLPVNDLAVCGNDVWAVGGGGTVFKGTSNFVSQGAYGTDDLYAVHCRSASEIWIAGDEVLFRNKLQVNDQDVQHAPYRGVWSPAANEAYMFGDADFGTYFDTANLLVYANPGGILPEVVNDLWGSSVDNLYAVAYTVNPFRFGYAVRFDGAQWQLVDVGAHRTPTSIHGYSALDIFIGTEGGGILRGVPPPQTTP